MNRGERRWHVELVKSCFRWLRGVGQKVGPYLMLELLMPGGTMLALLLFLYRRGTLPARA